MSYTQNMSGNRSFPERPDPSRKPSYGEMGDGIEINDEAPAGNKRLLDGGKFVQQQFHKGTDLNGVTPAETSIRSVRVADLGPEFGRGELNVPLEIAGEKRSLRKWQPLGGKASN